MTIDYENPWLYNGKAFGSCDIGETFGFGSWNTGIVDDKIKPETNIKIKKELFNGVKDWLLTL